MASYEEQAYYIYELIENMNESDITYTKILFDTFNLNKMHFEYLSEALLEFYEENNDGELFEINNEYFILKIKNSYFKIDIEIFRFNRNKEYLFRIQMENDLRKLNC